MTTKSDIERDGGTCEVVGTDWWECTDKHGKVWWCSNRGATCVPKPAAAPKIMGDLIKDGAKCIEISEKWAICKASDGSIWACDKRTGACILLPL